MFESITNGLSGIKQFVYNVVSELTIYDIMVGAGALAVLYIEISDSYMEYEQRRELLKLTKTLNVITKESIKFTINGDLRKGVFGKEFAINIKTS